MARFLIIVLFFFLYTNVYSQNPTQVSPQNFTQVFTPNAANLGQYGKIPVNYFNGLPEISIPLTTFKAKGYELPIELKYYASGNKPDFHPSWVGLGWSLNAGGMINRICNGKKDEASDYERTFYTGVEVQNYTCGYYYKAESLQNSNWKDSECLRNLINTSIRFGTNDTEPDEFQVNISDIQASFYLIGTNKIKIKSKTNVNFKVDIKLDTSNSSLVLYKNTRNGKDVESNLFTYISEIIITKDNGVKYYFGGDKNAIEFSIEQFPEYRREECINADVWNSRGTANTWMLKKIELTNGEVVEFNYGKSGVPIITNDKRYGHCYLVNNQALNPNDFFDSETTTPKYSNISFLFTQPVYLKSIKSKMTKNEIFFSISKSKELECDIAKDVFIYRTADLSYYDPNTKGEFSYENLISQNYHMQLDEIVEKNKRTKFHYSEDTQSRLKLLSLSFLNKHGEKINDYKLKYNNIKLPSYNSKKIDKWGYYNGKYYGNISKEDMDTYRTPDENLMQAEILTSITYPTGGHSEFIYEAHRYSKVAKQFDFAIESKTGIAGGLRIKEIRNIENGKEFTRKFEYVDSLGNSSGILSGEHLYDVRGKQHVKYNYSRWWDFCYYNVDVDYIANYNFWQDDNINQLSATDGNHVTYSRVIENKSDGSKIIYTYSNHDQFMDETPVSMVYNVNNKVLYNPFVSKELERGLLLKTEYVNKSGFLVKVNIKRYNSSPDRYNDFVKSISQMNLIDNKIIRFSALKIYTFYPYLESETVIEYNQFSGKLVTSVKNEYNSNKLISKISTVNSRGEEIVDIFRYSGDIQNGIYEEMKNNNIINSLIEKISVKKGDVIGSELSTYKKNESNNDYVLANLYRGKFDIPLPYKHFILFNGISKDNHYEYPEIEYMLYDKSSNIKEFVSKGSRFNVCIWGYNNECPICIFEGFDNVNSSSVFYQNFEDSYSDKTVPFGFHSNKSYLGVYTVALLSNPMRSYKIDYQVFENGKWIYKSDIFRNSKYIIDEGNNCIDEVRVYPKDVAVSSYTYFPFIGLRSKTNERGISESYNYGSLGRLISTNNTNDEIINIFDYKYYNETPKSISNIYYNVELRRTFMKTDCDCLSGEMGPVEYIVPEGTYTSSLSQEDANRQAYDDLISNGQKNANQNGQCLPYIIVSVYNPSSTKQVIELSSGIQGEIKFDYKIISPCVKVGNTGDVLKDFEPIKIYIPRRNYRSVRVYPENGSDSKGEISIKSTPSSFEIYYDMEQFKSYEDIYVIGKYPFVY